jgi:hypothetical protein
MPEITGWVRPALRSYLVSMAIFGAIFAYYALRRRDWLNAADWRSSERQLAARSSGSRTARPY